MLWDMANVSWESQDEHKLLPQPLQPQRMIWFCCNPSISDPVTLSLLVQTKATPPRETGRDLLSNLESRKAA